MKTTQQANQPNAPTRDQPGDRPVPGKTQPDTQKPQPGKQDAPGRQDKDAQRR